MLHKTDKLSQERATPACRRSIQPKRTWTRLYLVFRL